MGRVRGNNLLKNPRPRGRRRVASELHTEPPARMSRSAASSRDPDAKPRTERAIARLARKDVLVTNQSDKDVQLQKLEALATTARRSLSRAQTQQLFGLDFEALDAASADEGAEAL